MYDVINLIVNQFIPIDMDKYRPINEKWMPPSYKYEIVDWFLIRAKQVINLNVVLINILVEVIIYYALFVQYMNI
jgi:hypothetical protein